MHPTAVPTHSKLCALSLILSSYLGGNAWCPALFVVIRHLTFDEILTNLDEGESDVGSADGNEDQSDAAEEEEDDDIDEWVMSSLYVLVEVFLTCSSADRADGSQSSGASPILQLKEHQAGYVTVRIISTHPT